MIKNTLLKLQSQFSIVPFLRLRSRVHSLTMGDFSSLVVVLLLEQWQDKCGRYQVNKDPLVSARRGPTLLTELSLNAFSVITLSVVNSCWASCAHKRPEHLSQGGHPHSLILLSQIFYETSSTGAGYFHADKNAASQLVNKERRCEQTCMLTSCSSKP